MITRQNPTQKIVSAFKGVCHYIAETGSLRVMKKYSHHDGWSDEMVKNGTKNILLNGEK